MIIYIDSSVVDTVDVSSDDNLDVLSELARAGRIGSHIVLGDADALRHLANVRELAEKDRSSFLKFLDSRSTNSAVLSHVLWMCRIVGDSAQACPVVVNGHIREVHLPFSLLVGCADDVLGRTVLIAENLTDTDVCRVAMRCFTKKSQIAHVPFSARVENGGGSTTADVFERNIESGGLVLCVVDSDRRCPGDGLGDTARLVKRVDERSDGRSLMHVLATRSAENLFGPQVIWSVVSPKGGFDGRAPGAFESARLNVGVDAMMYVCLKSGLSCYDVSGPSRWSYWKTCFEGNGGACDGSRRCETREECPAVVVKGYGGNALKFVVEHVLERGDDGLNELFEQLESPHAEALLELGSAVFSWCCGSERDRT